MQEAGTVRPMSAAQASRWLGGVVTPEKLLEAATRKRIAHTKLPHDGAYLFFESDLLEYCRRTDHRVERASGVGSGAGPMRLRGTRRTG